MQQTEEFKKETYKDLEGAKEMLTEMKVAKERAERSKTKLQKEACLFFISILIDADKFKYIF